MRSAPASSLLLQESAAALGGGSALEQAEPPSYGFDALASEADGWADRVRASTAGESAFSCNESVLGALSSQQEQEEHKPLAARFSVRRVKGRALTFVEAVTTAQRGGGRLSSSLPQSEATQQRSSAWGRRSTIWEGTRGEDSPPFELNAVECAIAAAEVERRLSRAPSGDVLRKTSEAVNMPPPRSVQRERRRSQLALAKGEELPARRVAFGNAEANAEHAFVDNYVSTTKYTVLAFLPIALYEQYRRVANQYFTVVAVLSATPISPVQAFSTITPLVFVLGVSLLKEALEDRARYRQDVEQNSRECRVAHGGKWVSKGWREVLPGDVLLVHKDEPFPCDMVMLASSGEEQDCYVETMNLDGETNLKPKKAVEVPEGVLDSAGKDARAAAATTAMRGTRLECETPNASLYTFRGNMFWPGSAEGTPMAPTQVLLRGSNLRNTDWVLGGAIFTGHDTKVMQNSVDAPSKRSTIERNLDYIVGGMFCLLMVLCITTGICTGLWTKYYGNSQWYLMPEEAPGPFDPAQSVIVGTLSAVTSMILYGYLIPISLYVSIEVVKVAQAFWFINRDSKMYHEESGTWAQARTSNLNEELGQVENVLTDKTGTLTCNRMEFNRVSIAGQEFGDPNGRPVRPHRAYNFADPRLEGGAWRQLDDTTRTACELLFLNLALCSTCVPTPDEEHGIKYEAESPDEEALVVAAKQLGWTLKSRSMRDITIVDPEGREVVYELLHVIEFNSTRKRMSVIVRQPGTGRLLMLCKGADSIIYERLAPTSPHRETTQQHLDSYAVIGLRTLCIAYAELDEARYADWDAEYSKAKRSLDEDRDRVLDGLAEAIEKDLMLLGATAIEDRLQNRVPEVIEQLQEAGIRVWMLTGDKLETARNIGLSCRLLRTSMTVFTVEATDVMEVAIEADAGKESGSADLLYGDRALKRAVGQQLAEALTTVRKARAAPDGAEVKFALIVEGKALVHALDPKLSDLFMLLTDACTAVICCRVSPLQKAQVTRLVRSGGGVLPPRICLGIGDGANDVGMIREAHIGVGISGFEGRQAVLASDFAIAQFEYLERLLLVHGRWNYKRIARMILYFFMKNVVMGLVLFSYSLLCFFSTQTPFEGYTLMLYNVFFTSLPVVVCGVLDQDVSEEVSLKYPGLYRVGIRNEYLKPAMIGTWVLNSFYITLTVMVMVFMIHTSSIADMSDGTTPGLWAVGFTLYSCIVWSVNLTLGLTVYNWTWLHHLSIWGSIAVLYLYALAFSSLPIDISTGMHELVFRVFATPSYWLSILLVPPVSLLAIFVYRVCQRNVRPMDHHIVQEIAQHSEGMRANSAAAAGKVADNRRDLSSIELARMDG